MWYWNLWNILSNFFNYNKFSSTHPFPLLCSHHYKLSLSSWYFWQFEATYMVCFSRGMYSKYFENARKFLLNYMYGWILVLGNWKRVNFWVNSPFHLTTLVFLFFFLSLSKNNLKIAWRYSSVRMLLYNSSEICCHIISVSFQRVFKLSSLFLKTYVWWSAQWRAAAPRFVLTNQPRCLKGVLISTVWDRDREQSRAPSSLLEVCLVGAQDGLCCW